MADLHYLSPFFPQYDKRETSSIRVTWTPVLKPKCTSSLNVTLRSKYWQKIFRGNQFPHVSCSTQATREILVAVTWLHLVKKGTKSMPTSVVLIEKHKGLCLLILLLLKIWRYEPSFNVVRQNENKNVFWLLEVRTSRKMLSRDQCKHPGMQCKCFVFHSSGCRWKPFLG